MGSPTPRRPVRRIDVPWTRLEGWTGRFEARQPGTTWRFDGDRVSGEAPDGTQARWSIPFADQVDRVGSMGDLAVHLARPWRLAVLLVRRGGFAVAHQVGLELKESKVGQRHVQSRSKAGGWSQQRFARRRAHQATQAFDAAAEHARAILLPHAGDLDLLGSGGDRTAVAHVLADPRLAHLGRVPQRWLDGVPDPKRAALLAAIERLRSVTIEITDPPTP